MMQTEGIPLPDALPFGGRFHFPWPAGYTPRSWHRDALEAFQMAQSDAKGTQLRFLVYAATGSGKTCFAAMVAAHLLNQRDIDRVVYVCPNRAIQDSVVQTFRRFGIALSIWKNRRGAHSEAAHSNGSVLTYQMLSESPTIHNAICAKKRTLVIFDEIHHLGDALTWGQTARVAFEANAQIILSLSGTPWRTDDTEIPFVRYLPTQNGMRRFQHDFAYSLGTAVREGVCRDPNFYWFNDPSDVNYQGNKFTTEFRDGMDEGLANIMLADFVKPGSPARLNALRKAIDDCARHERKLIIFLGGDTTSETTATADAETDLPNELRKLGLTDADFSVVTSKTKDSANRIKTFGGSSARILVTVNMVSEGVDIPQLSAALFLSSITAKSTFIQRIGRVLRGSGIAFIYAPAHPVLKATAEEINAIINREFKLAGMQRREGVGNGGRGPAQPRDYAIWYSAHMDGVTLDGRHYSQQRVEQAAGILASRNLPTDGIHLANMIRILDSTEGSK